MAIVDKGRLVDGITALDGGMDSGRSPSTIAPNQCAFAGNVTFRGGFAETRPGFKRVQLAASSAATALTGGKFQGAGHFDYSTGQLIVVVGGNTYTITPPSTGTSWSVADITDSNTMSTTRERVHMVQVEDNVEGTKKSWVIIQDGATSPFLWDGSASSKASDVSARVPIGTGPMAYGQGRLWVAQGNSYVASDIYGGTNGVLKFTENQYLAGGGSFSVPLSAGNITAMRFVAAPNTALGQGELVIGTSDMIFTSMVPADRYEWFAVTDPLQRVALINNGAMSHFSTELVNGDVFMRSRDGIRSIIQAVRDFDQLGNTPISGEMHRVLKHDEARYLQYTSGVLFDNRYLLTSQSSYNSSTGPGFKGLVALDFSTISSMKGKSPPAYDGFWTLDITRSGTTHNMHFLQLVKGKFDDVERCIAFVRNGDGDTELWELAPDGDEIEDIDVNSSGVKAENKITSEVETPSFDFDQIGAAKTLESADLWVDEVTGGTVTFHADFHPDQYPCWMTWQDWSVIAESSSILESISLTGTGSVPLNSSVLTGSGTSFTAELSDGDTITVGGVEFVVDSITSDTVIQLKSASASAITAAAMVRIITSCQNFVDYQKQYRPRMRLGTPTDAEEPAVGKPFNYGWEFAARLKWTGHARIKLFRLNARETQEEPYADVNIDSAAKAIACDCLSGVTGATSQ